MELFKKYKAYIRKYFKWYAENEHIELNEMEVITDFLRYWFNDGINFIAGNQADRIFYKKHPTADYKDIDIEWYYDSYLKHQLDYSNGYRTNENGDIELTPPKIALTDKDKLTLEYMRLLNHISMECGMSIRFIIKHYDNLVSLGFIKDNQKSLFGFDLWKNGCDLKKEILRFALMEKVYNVKTYCVKELTAMGVDKQEINKMVRSCNND